MAGMSASARATLELANLEMEAKSTARKHVANLLQRPDQLEKVEAIRKRVSRKKASVEAMLKTAVQSQLDGVRTGMNQLHNALRDIKAIKEGLDEVDDIYSSISGLGEKLEAINEENAKHSQLAAAVENLKHIFTVPETVKKCEEFISDGKLLHAHKCLTDLEGSRDDLLFELHKQPNQSPTDKNTVNQYFHEVPKLSEALGKQLWLILQRTIMTLRREPTIIVTVLRIIEREEKMDVLMMKRYDQTGFMPPGRPKRWRQKALSVLEEAVLGRIEGNQMEDRSTNKMWLVRHLEVTRQLVLEDLRVVKTLCEPCFPPVYDIVNKYIAMYHNGISQHLNEVFQQGLEGNEMVTLLTWMHEYRSRDMMGHPDLKIDVSEFPPLLEPTVISEIQNQYLQIMRSNFTEWMRKSLNTDVEDWKRTSPPEADDKGFFSTSLPIIVFQILQQNLQVAATVSDGLVTSCLALCLDELDSFVRTYRVELQSYKDKHFQDRSKTQFFIHYMIANINNCETLAGLTNQIKGNYVKNPNQNVERFGTVSDAFNRLAYEICDILLEEVFLDLDTHLQELVTRKWLQSRHAVDTICITLEDYCSDFVHVRDRYYDILVGRAMMRVAAEYIKSMFTRKMTFKNYEERLPAAEKICQEADQLTQMFKKLSSEKTDGESPFDVLCGLSEVIKLEDTSMMSLELSGLVHNYPDVRIDQLVNLLVMRGDIDRGKARTLVTDCLGEDHDLKPKAKLTILSKLYS